MTGGWMIGGGWMTGGCWVAHPAASNMTTINDRNFTLRSLAPLTPRARWRYTLAALRSSIHDDRQRYLNRLLRINDGLFQLCKSLTDKRDIETSSCLIPLVDELTHNLRRSSMRSAISKVVL